MEIKNDIQVKLSHPIVRDLKEKLHIPYMFYIDEYKDLKTLLEHIGFKLKDHIPGENGKFVFDKEKGNKVYYRITIDKFIFDEDFILKPLQHNEWKSSFIDMQEFDDKLPF